MRGVLLIVRRSLRLHALSTTVTALSLALAGGLVLAVFTIEGQTRRAFSGADYGFDAVLGPRGSQLQIVLNTVFHLETSPGNVPYTAYEELRDDRRVRVAVPYVVGDSYRGFRVVGTTRALFEELEYVRGEPLAVFEDHQLFDPDRREAVIGSAVARETGLRRGSVFQPTHSLAEAAHAHEEEFVVVGVLRPTSTPVDRVVFVPLEAMYRMEGHVLKGAGEEYRAQEGEAIPDEVKEVSAVLISFANPLLGQQMARIVNQQGSEQTLAYPLARSLAELFDKVGWIARVLRLVAYLVVLVAAASVLASLYNAMNERRREFAVLRALGARRRTVFSAIVLESATIAALGAALSFAVYAAILWVAVAVVRAQTGVVLEASEWHPVLVAAPLGLVVLGALAGLVPAAKAYRTDVAANLAPTS